MQKNGNQIQGQWLPWGGGFELVLSLEVLYMIFPLNLNFLFCL